MDANYWLSHRRLSLCITRALIVTWHKARRANATEFEAALMADRYDRWLKADARLTRHAMGDFSKERNPCSTQS